MIYSEAMDTVYNHKEFEEKIYKKWEASNAFTPKINKRKKPFTIIMPPPNANDPLHIGHARFVAISDILVRYYRMKGKEVLWLPGSDHAGIETQYVFEKKLKEKGKSRFDYGREELFQMIWNYVIKNTGTMERQLKRLGASADWTRFKFTLDPDIVSVVLKTFKKLYDEGYVYRGEKIVNYCPRCGTNFSELEVNHVERTDNIYFLNYGPISVATTRPETIFADIAIAVNPKDKRYERLVGKTAKIPLVEREIPIIADSLVNKDFGTGALKITPGHDATDFEIGQKHNLPMFVVIDEQGRMTSVPKKYIGLKAEAAREQVVKDLEEKGLLKKTEKIVHTVGVCYRDKGLIEPRPAKQWFIKMKDLSGKALKSINDKEVKFASKKQEKIAKHWLRNIKDWNISRQIVWGIRIPAFRCDKCLEWTITEGEAPTKCMQCGHEKLTQDTDTFDTWFSSSQWPFATLMTTKGDFEYFYPTSVMVTAYDILFFWVTRMIMLGLYATSQTPFKDVVLHGLVRDREGQKISKSKGNVIDPIEMTDKYGADALRMGLVWGALIDNDISLSEENIRGQRNFANKLWNVSRFILSPNSNVNLSAIKRPRVSHSDDKKILKELASTQKKLSRLIESYRLSQAAEELYDFIWYKFANDYLERTKERRSDAQPVLEYVLARSLIISHPFMPFVTEAIWQMGAKGLLITTSWD